MADESLNEAPFRCRHTSSLAELLEPLWATLLVTTYQAGKLAAFRRRVGRCRS